MNRSVSSHNVLFAIVPVIWILWVGASPLAAQCEFIRGNITNQTGADAIDLNDAVDLLAFLFLGTEGSRPDCLDAADVNDNGIVEIGDYLYLVHFLFDEGAPPPPPPFPDRGVDPTPGVTVSADVDARFKFRIGSAFGFPSNTGLEIPIYLSNEAPIQGLQMAFEYDGDVLRIDEFRLEETALAEFSDRSYIIYQFFNRAGVSHAGLSALLNYDPPLSGQTIAAGEDQLLAVIVAGVQITAEPQTTRIRFVDDVVFPGPVPDDARPGVHNLVVTEDGSLVRPQFVEGEEGGSIEIKNAFIRGDANLDRRVDISDSVFLLQYLFYGGPSPACEDSSDINNDSRIDLSDAVFVLNYLFRGGPQPPAPYPAPGLDPEIGHSDLDPLACDI